MNPTKKDIIEDFIYAAILTDDFFDALYQTMAEEIDLEDEEVEDLIEEHEARYEENVVRELSEFIDKNFTDEEVASLVEEPSEDTLTKFDGISEQFYKIIETNTEKFVDGLLQEINACEDKDSCCCN